MLAEESCQRLANTLELVPDSVRGMRVEDSRVASFTYGLDRNPEIPRDVNASE